jgi:phage baseplate assembly protein V
VLGVNRSDHTTSGVGSREASNHARVANNLMRYGQVKEADYEKGLLRVDIQDGDLETAWLPWLTLRSGNDRFWWAPEVGERVMVLAPSGELHNGVVMAAQISSDFPQIANKETVQRTEFSDGTVIQYDREEGHYLLDVQGDITIRATGNVTIIGERIDLNP